jgi:hypothetical protein
LGNAKARLCAIPHGFASFMCGTCHCDGQTDLSVHQGQRPFLQV